MNRGAYRSGVPDLEVTAGLRQLDEQPSGDRFADVCQTAPDRLEHCLPLRGRRLLDVTPEDLVEDLVRVIARPGPDYSKTSLPEGAVFQKPWPSIASARHLVRRTREIAGGTETLHRVGDVVWIKASSSRGGTDPDVAQLTPVLVHNSRIGTATECQLSSAIRPSLYCL